MHKAPTASEISAIQRMLLVAKGDGPATEVIAKVLLSTWRPEAYGHLDLFSLRHLSDTQRADVVAVLGYCISAGHGLDDLGLEHDLAAIARLWGS